MGDDSRECYRCKGRRVYLAATCPVCRGAGRLDLTAWYPIPEQPQPPASWKPAAAEQRKPYPSTRCECGATMIPGRDHTCRPEYRR